MDDLNKFILGKCFIKVRELKGCMKKANVSPNLQRLFNTAGEELWKDRRSLYSDRGITAKGLWELYLLFYAVKLEVSEECARIDIRDSHLFNQEFFNMFNTELEGILDSVKAAHYWQSDAEKKASAEEGSFSV